MNMKLPNYEHANISLSKLQDYVLNENHPVGKYKARVFDSALYIKSSDAETLKEKILLGLPDQDAIETEADRYGKRFFVDINIRNLNREAIVRTAWIVLQGEDFPRLVSCYVKK
ncbi:MAG: hypothetical protein KIT62_03950 [Cyclobacteriaceae bacterium]|nr:hypothetical protein [Cyclobacteriaceae bacterium]